MVILLSNGRAFYAVGGILSSIGDTKSIKVTPLESPLLGAKVRLLGPVSLVDDQVSFFCISDKALVLFSCDMSFTIRSARKITFPKIEHGADVLFSVSDASMSERLRVLLLRWSSSLHIDSSSSIFTQYTATLPSAYCFPGKAEVPFLEVDRCFSEWRDSISECIPRGVGKWGYELL